MNRTFNLFFTVILMVLTMSSMQLSGQEKAIIDVPLQKTNPPYRWGEIPGNIVEFGEKQPVEEFNPATSEQGSRQASVTRKGVALAGDNGKETGTVTDHQGNEYSTVLIGDRWWMAENLLVTTYANGDPISDGTGVTEFDHDAGPAYYFYYDDDPANVPVYGKLYTWYVVADSRGICPAGWYIPTGEDWQGLLEYLDPDGDVSDNIAGGKMKATGTLEDGTGLWESPNAGATNESGFTSLPGGIFRQLVVAPPDFMALGRRAFYASSTEVSENIGMIATNETSSEGLWFSPTFGKDWASSVRCIQKTTETAELPTVTTLDAQDVSVYTATLEGEVVDDGGNSVSNRGFYFGIHPEPDENDTRLYLGSGAGVMETEIENLRPETTYYFRAYARNVEGEALGDVKSFTTTAMTQEQAMDIASTSFLAYWQALKNYNAGMTAGVMANHTTASWSNYAWLDSSHEPRTPWDNSPDYHEAWMTLNVWNGLYGLVQEVNDVIYAIEEQGLEMGSGDEHHTKVLATMYFIRGVSHGQLGLTFDQGWVNQDNGDLSTYPLSPWSDVIEAAVGDLEQSISIADGDEFAWDNDEVSGMVIDADYLGRLSASYAARFLVLGSRTSEQNEDLSWTSCDWSDVLAFAGNGITEDFAPVGDGGPWQGGTWWDLHIKYLRNPGWGRVDMRVMHLLDPSQPLRFPTDNQGMPVLDELPENGMAYSEDARLLTDFEYLPTHNFTPDRGGWHFSHYRHSRYDYPETTNSEGYHMGESLGPLRELRVYENELMLAEAMIRSANDVAGAAAIVNDAENPRKDRGELEDVAEEAEALLDAIFYERDIELIHNGYLLSYGDMRRRDMLQQGTPLHFPVPGAILEWLDEENYTFGGYFNADGVNTSDGGDWIKPWYHFAEVEIEIDGNGSTSPSEGVHLLNKGYNEIFAYPGQGWVLDKWVVDQSDEYEGSVLNIDIQSESLIQAFFVETQDPQYELTLSLQGEGNIVPQSGSYYLMEGESISLEATTDDPDWFFVNWATDEGVEVSDEAAFSYTMPGNDVSLVAHFETEVTSGDGWDNPFSVYPNPASTRVFVRNYEGLQKVALFDVTGQKVYGALVSNQQDYTLEVTDFTPGVYLLRLTGTEGRQHVQRIIISHR